MMSFPRKNIFLGTARWGQGIDFQTACEMVKIFTDFGFSSVDTASNYPISGKASEFGMAIEWLGDIAKKQRNLQIHVKLGALTNSRTPDLDLSLTYFALKITEMRDLLDQSFSGAGIHWDDSTESLDLSDLLGFLQTEKKLGMRLSLSGIERLENYIEIGKEGSSFDFYEINISPWKKNYSEQDFTRIKRIMPEIDMVGYNFLGGSRYESFSGAGTRLENLFQLTGSNNKEELFSYLIESSVRLGINGLIIEPKNEVQCFELCTALTGYCDV